jgi:hypothetical protein
MHLANLIMTLDTSEADYTRTPVFWQGIFNHLHLFSRFRRLLLTNRTTPNIDITQNSRSHS